MDGEAAVAVEGSKALLVELGVVILLAEASPDSVAAACSIFDDGLEVLDTVVAEAAAEQLVLEQAAAQQLEPALLELLVADRARDRN